MVSKLRAGILSCTGLISLYILKGIVMIPILTPENLQIYILIIQLGVLWFSIALWMVLKYDFVKLHHLEELKKPVYWLIINITLANLAIILTSLIPKKELVFVTILTGLILTINYIIIFIKLYKLDKYDLIFINDIHNYVIAMLIMMIGYFIINTINEFIWRRNLDYMFYFMNAIPPIFLMSYLIKEKKEIKNNQPIYSLD